MKVTALILGIIGGLAGLGGALFALIVGGISTGMGGSTASQGGGLVGLGIAAIVFSIVGIVGGGLALSKPKVAGILMLVAAVGGLISVSWGYALAFPLFLVGGILGLVASRKPKEQAQPMQAAQQAEQTETATQQQAL